jgi:outer membrane protein assembly factor BamB
MKLHRLCYPLLTLVTLSVAWASEGNSWPQWRGPDRTDVSKETGLLKEWPAKGPTKLWTFKDAGEGYAGFAIVDGKLYTMGARDGKEYLLVLDAEAGKELWNTEIGAQFSYGQWGDGPRGTPTLDGDHLYALGGQGTLICVNLPERKIVWKKRMQDLGGSVPQWGYSESVLVDGDKVICTPGGSKGALAALNKQTGEVIWQSKEYTGGAQYASVVPAVINGQRQYIQLLMKSFAGVAADSGKLLWKADWSVGRTAVIPTPIVHDNYVYITAGYGAGCKLVRIEGNKAEEVYANKNMANHHGGVVLVGEHLYGYSDGKGWICQNFKTGETVWSERRKLGKGGLTCADGMLYCMDENNGTVVLAEASPAGWKEHGRFKLEPQSEQRKPQGKIWTHPVVVNGKLYLRDQEFICCYDVKAK